MPSLLQVVWFKRDLRITDHRPLVEAAARGPVLPLYILEPSILAEPDFEAMHWGFIRESLEGLDTALTTRGARLRVETGEAVTVFERLRNELGTFELRSHEETGTQITFERDKAVAAWCRRHGILWQETPTNGVVRRLRDRNGWSALWEKRMHEPLLQAPKSIRPVCTKNPPAPTLPLARDLGLEPAPRAAVQRGGPEEGRNTLETFLAGRGARYSKEMSSPLTAESSCSRLSPYLAWGCLSMREIVQRTREAKHALEDTGWRTGEGERFLKGSLNAFLGRCHWHCHFIQKLESEPAIEFHCFNRSYDGLREADWSTDRFEAYAAGQTGFPFVDACMRFLKAHGWINFRMRAMLTSFAAYNLWLDWRGFKDFLACQFLDYEPGIHISQLQMQSGVTGINTLRIYNPVKQGYDQDPEGAFIRRWVPELAGLSGRDLHEPWEASVTDLASAGVTLGKSYPLPIVDQANSAREARSRIGAVRRTDDARSAAKQVYEKHGSRRGPATRRLKGEDAAEFSSRRHPDDPRQTTLQLDS